MVAPLETELYDDVGRGLPALLSSVRAFEVALELAEAEALVLLEAEALGDAVSEAEALALDELAAEDEGVTVLTEEEQALRASKPAVAPTPASRPRRVSCLPGRGLDGAVMLIPSGAAGHLGA